MEDLHEGANVLLAYWHYYRTDEDPLDVECIDRHRSRLADLEAGQFSFVKKSCRLMREKSEFLFLRFCFCFCRCSLFVVRCPPHFCRCFIPFLLHYTVYPFLSLSTTVSAICYLGLAVVVLGMSC